jgi:hypothetical protein
MIVRALAPWLLLAAFLLFPSLIAAGLAGVEAMQPATASTADQTLQVGG